MMWPTRSRPAIVARAARQHPPKASIWWKFATRRAETASAKEFDLRLAEPEEIRRCGRDRPIDRKDRDLELVAGGDGIGEHQAMGHVEPLDRAGARPAGRPRQFAIDPDFCVVVDIHPEHRHRARRV